MTETAMQNKTALDIKQILDILPHRYPFLFVDKILEINLEKGYIIGQKNVSMHEEFFQGHFPGAPIMPGVLILEALAQSGAVYVHMKTTREKVAVLLNIKNAKFRRPVHPGDVLILCGEERHMSSKAGRIFAEAKVDDRTVAEAEFSFALVEKSQL